MKKIFLLLFSILFIIQSANAELSTNSVNLFNLKEKNVYMLLFPSKVREYNVIREDYIKLTPMTSVSNDKKIMMVEAKKLGVSDVSVRTEENLYQIRFVVGPEFQDNSKDLIEIDLPSAIHGGR